jgi:hypothetical protein
MPIRNQLAEGKFKKVLIHCEDLKKESCSLHSYLEEIQILETENRLMDWEIVLLFILLYLKHRSKKVVVRENPNFQKKFIELHKIQKYTKIHDLSISLQDLFQEREDCTTIFDYLLSKRFLKIPAEIKECILHWALGNYSLFLIHTVPTPMEVLFRQAEGNRMITLSYIHSSEGALMPGNRDGLEFVLHDISHAHTFFNPYYNPQGQKEFFRNLIKKWIYLKPYFRDLEFQKKLEYLQCDMNSHPEHLRSYLRAILGESKKRIRDQKKMG